MIAFLKKIWAWIVSIPSDKLLHDYAGALIAKEVYDYLKPEGHSVEAADIGFGIFGILKVDVALLILAFVIA